VEIAAFPVLAVQRQEDRKRRQADHAAHRNRSWHEPGSRSVATYDRKGVGGAVAAIAPNPA